MSTLAPQTCAIASGDLLNASIQNVNNGLGYLPVTNVTSAAAANGQQMTYTVTITGGTTVVANADRFTLMSTQGTVSKWVLGKN